MSSKSSRSPYGQSSNWYTEMCCCMIYGLELQLPQKYSVVHESMSPSAIPTQLAYTHWSSQFSHLIHRPLGDATLSRFSSKLSLQTLHFTVCLDLLCLLLLVFVLFCFAFGLGGTCKACREVNRLEIFAIGLPRLFGVTISEVLSIAVFREVCFSSGVRETSVSGSSELLPDVPGTGIVGRCISSWSATVISSPCISKVIPKPSTATADCSKLSASAGDSFIGSVAAGMSSVGTIRCQEGRVFFTLIGKSQISWTYLCRCRVLDPFTHVFWQVSICIVSETLFTW